MQSNFEGKEDVSADEPVADKDINAALNDLIKEFEAYQADPEPILSSSEIAEMEGKESGQSKSPVASSYFDSESQKQVEPVPDFSDPLPADGMKAEIESNESEPSTNEGLVGEHIKRDKDVMQSENFENEEQENLVSNDKNLEENTSHSTAQTGTDNSEQKGAGEVATESELPNPIKSESEEPVILGRQHERDEAIEKADEVISDKASEPGTRQEVLPETIWMPKKSVLSTQDENIFWNVISNLFINTTRYIHSIFDSEIWKKRIQAIRKKQEIQKIILPPVENDPTGIKVYHCGLNQPICHVTTDFSNENFHKMPAHKWEKEVEGTAQIIWSELENNDENPNEGEHYLTSKISDTGQTSLVCKVGSCGAIGHYADSIKSSEVEDFKKFVQSIDNDFPEIFLSHSASPKISDSYESLEIKMTDWVQSKRSKNRKPSLIGSAAIVCMVFLFFIQSYFVNSKQAQFQEAVSRMIDALNNEPGIQVVHAKNKDIQLLKDPFARNPNEVISEYPESDRLNLQMFPFDSNDSEMVFRRVRSFLNPTPNVSLTVFGKRLILSGTASKDWIEKARLFASSIAGVHEVSMDGLKPELPKILTQSLRTSSVEIINAKILSINNKRIQFETDKTLLLSGESSMVDEVFSEIVEVLQMARDIGIESRIELTGYVTLEEYVKFGDELGLERAKRIKSLLTLKGLPVEEIFISSKSRKIDNLDGNRPKQGAVVLGISLNDPSKDPEAELQ